jgi:hypothetical protein
MIFINSFVTIRPLAPSMGKERRMSDRGHPYDPGGG